MSTDGHIIGRSNLSQREIDLETSYLISGNRSSSQWSICKNKLGRIVKVDDIVFAGFAIDEQKFLKWRYPDYLRNMSHEKLYDCELLKSNGIEDCAIEMLRLKVSNVALKMRNEIGSPFGNVLEAIFKTIGICDESVIVLTGLAIAMCNTIGRDTNTCPIDRDTEEYAVLTQLIRAYFERKMLESDDFYWRKLMREIVANMRLFAYLNIEVN